MADPLEMSLDERDSVANALDREASRLEGRVKEYRASRKPTNQAVRDMAEEGVTSAEVRIKTLRALAAKVRPLKPVAEPRGVQRG